MKIKIMKLLKNQKGFNDAVVVAILGGIIGALFITGVFIWKEIDKQNTVNNFYTSISNLVKVEEVKEEVEAEVITSGFFTTTWKVYRNEELGFEVKYPKDWYHRENGSQFTPGPLGPNNDFGIFVGIISNVDDLNYEDAILKHRQRIPQYMKKNTTEYLISLNDEDYIQFRPSSGRATYILDNNNLWLISFIPAGEIPLDMYNAFLLNFKFLDNESPSISDWKRYVNEEFGLSFEYPSDWSIYNEGEHYMSFNYSQSYLSAEFRLLIRQNPNKEPVYDFYNNIEENKKTKGNEGLMYSWYEMSESQKTIIIDDIEAINFISPMGIMENTAVVIPKDDIIVEIQIRGVEEIEKGSAYEAILKSFKFLDKKDTELSNTTNQTSVSSNEWEDLLRYNCELSGGSFSNHNCECPIEEGIGQTQENMYNKSTGYCQTTYGGPGGDAFAASIGLPFGTYNFWTSIIRNNCEETSGVWSTARCICSDQMIYDKSTGYCK